MAALHAFPARIAGSNGPAPAQPPPQIKNGVEQERATRWFSLIPPIRFLFFGSFFSFSERKERTIPPTAAHTPRGGPPDGLRANPSPIRFLFFGSFFSFSERKERTEHPFSFPERKERTEKKNDQENTGWDKKAAGAGRAGRWGTLKRSGGAFSRPCSRAARPRRSRPAGAAAPFRWSFR